MPARSTLAIYLALFAAAAVIAGSFARIVLWTTAAWGCATRLPAGSFVATCLSDVFGDYERGAYYYGLEREAVAHVRKAQVLFLGSSRAQFAFSTGEVRDYFERRRVPYYVFGFAEGGSQIAQMMIGKLGVEPKLLVVTADPFFGSPRKEALWTPDDELGLWERGWRRFDYRTKEALQAAVPWLCGAFEKLCSRRTRVVFRASRDGMWEWRDHFLPAEFQQIPVPAPAALEPSDEARGQVARARAFLQAVGVAPDCLVLTVTPDTQYLGILNERFVADLARELGATAIVPKLEGLTTIDTTHLTWSSAQRWSTAFLAEIGPLMQHCVR